MVPREAVELIALKDLSPEARGAIRSIRNEAQVRASMYTDHEIGEREHAAWLERALDESDARYFAILAQDVLAGMVNLRHIDLDHRRADWGFYLSGRFAGQGIGRAFAQHFFDHTFGPLGLNKINGEVIETNAASCGFHQALGFKPEGFRRAHIIRNAAPLGIHLFGLTRDDWQAGCA